MKIQIDNPTTYGLVMLLLLIAVFLSYGGNGSHELLQWDDLAYVSNNDWITNPSGQGLIAIFTEFRVFNWHPITWLSYIPEYAVCGDNAICYKTTNIVLHALNSFLVFILCSAVLVQLKTKFNTSTLEDNRQLFTASLIAALLYAVHPQHSESVIWVAERKDLLCGMFYLAALISYLRYHAKETATSRHLPFLFFVLACMSKPMAVSLPAILVLFDLLLLKRVSLEFSTYKKEQTQQLLKVIVKEKLHFHFVMLAMMAITVLAQSTGSVELSSQGNSVLVVASALQHYVISFLFPFALSPFYPVEIVSTSPFTYVPLGLMLLALGLCLYFLRRYEIVLLLAGSYLLILAPVVGVVTIGDHLFADRYSYLPTISFYILTAYWISKGLFHSKLASRIGAIPFILVTALLISITHQYKNTWQDDLVLWQSVDLRYPDTSIIIANNLGNAYFVRGDYNLARESFASAIEIDPNRPRAYANLASTYQTLGNTEQALQTFAAGASNNPSNVGLKVSAGFAFANANQGQRALEYFNEALSQDRDFAPALLGLGSLLFRQGDIDGAVETLQRIPQNSEVDYDARLVLAQALAISDKSQGLEVLAQLRRDYPEAESIDAVNDWINQL